MFTGIVEELGKLVSLEMGSDSGVITVEADKVLEECQLGDTIAVNGDGRTARAEWLAVTVIRPAAPRPIRPGTSSRTSRRRRRLPLLLMCDIQVPIVLREGRSVSRHRGIDLAAAPRVDAGVPIPGGARAPVQRLVRSGTSYVPDSY